MKRTCCVSVVMSKVNVSLLLSSLSLSLSSLLALTPDVDFITHR